MIPKWHWTPQGQRYTTYVLLVSLSPKFRPVSPYDQRFLWYRTFFILSLNPVLPPPPRKEKNKKTCQKSKIWNFTLLYTTLVDSLLRSMPEFWGANLLCTFRQDVAWSWYFFFIWSHVNDVRKNNHGRNPKFQILPIFIQLGRYPA